MPYMTANSYWGLAPEGSYQSASVYTATYGTAASISTYTPIGSPKLTPTLKWLDDSDFRGSPVMHYDQVAGVRNDMFSGKTFMYSDVYPSLIRSTLGGVDVVGASVSVTNSVGASAVAYPHTIGLLNSASTGSQSPSYTIVNNSVDQSYQITGARAVDLSLTFAADAAVETTFSFAGNISASISPVTTVTESTQHLVPSWNVSASIGGASVAVVERATLDIKRSTAPIFTIGQQGPYNNFQGPIDVMGQMDFVVETNGVGDNFYSQALTTNQQQVILKFTDPATGYFVQFQMSKVQLEDPVIDQSKAYINLQTKFTAVANTIDAVYGGYSPIKAVVYNGVSTAY